MRKNNTVIAALLLSMLLLIACGEEKPYGHYEDDKMIGFVWEVDTENNVVEIDISEWEKRDRRGDIITSEAYSYHAEITDETVIQHEDGTSATVEDVRKGQKVLVNPPRGNNIQGIPEELILLEMTYEEKYSMLLSHLDHKLNIVIMYEEAEELPYEWQEEMIEKITDIVVDIDKRPVGGWIQYEQDYVVDYKDELGIEEFPVIMIFSSEELVFKTYDVNEVYDFFEDLN